MSEISKANLIFLLTLILFSYVWVRFSSALTFMLFRPLFDRLKRRRKLSTAGIFRLGLFFQTTLLLMAYAAFLISLPLILDILYPLSDSIPQGFIGLSLIVFFCANWLMGIQRWNADIDQIQL